MTTWLAKIGKYPVHSDVEYLAKPGYIFIHVKITAIRLSERKATIRQELFTGNKDYRLMGIFLFDD